MLEGMRAATQGVIGRAIMTVVLGLISTKQPQLEDAAVLMRRIE